MTWWLALGSASSLAFVYVGSLYVFSSGEDRDNPATIRKRFLSAFTTVVISPFVVKSFGSPSLLASHPLNRVIGVRTDGLLAAALLPVVLTAVLFTGPLAVSVSRCDRPRVKTKFIFWQYSLRDLKFWRNYFVAPFTEEFTFRACIIPLLWGGFSPLEAVVISPMLFGVAHFHHMIERVRSGCPLGSAFILSAFQFAYTTVFGIYSAYLFVRTGHLASCVLVHSFCNFMGFPDLGELALYPPRRRALLTGAYFAGLCLFCLLLPTISDPGLYSNDIYSDSRELTSLP